MQSLHGLVDQPVACTSHRPRGLIREAAPGLQIRLEVLLWFGARPRGNEAA